MTTGTREVSIAHMKSPAGWSEPAQTPEFDEYTLVLKGCLRVEHDGEALDVRAGEAVHGKAGEHVRHGSPLEGGAEHVAVCLPAFTLEAAKREE